MANQMQVVDMGEFTVFCRDFNIQLARAKISEIFKRVGQNKPSLDYKKFLAVLRQMGEELSKAKLRENQGRLKEFLAIVKFLDLKDKYENQAWGKCSPEQVQQQHEKILKALENKSNHFTKHVENNLKQKYMLSDSVQPIKPPVVKSTRKSAIVKEAPVKAEAVESKEKPGTSPVKSEGVQKSPRKKKELSTEERAKRDQKNWEKTVTAIDALDQLELEVEDTGVSGVHSPEYLKFIENPIFEEMAKVQKTIDTLETIIKQKLFEDYMQEDVMELNHQ